MIFGPKVAGDWYEICSFRDETLRRSVRQGGRPMFTRILVPIDFSPPSDAALAYARRLAGTFESVLHLLHIADATFLRAVVADPADRDTAVLNRLDDYLTDED